MPECDQCGEKDISQSCSYCDGSFCAEHRLPENHDCPGLKNRQVSAEIGAGAPEGAVLGEVETDENDKVDLSRREPKVATSPDTNLDGSLGESKQPEEIDRSQPDRPGTIQRVRATLEVQWNRGGAISRTLLRALGIVTVVIGAYNFLLFPFVGGEQVLTQYYSFLPLFLSEITLMAVGASITWFL